MYTYIKIEWSACVEYPVTEPRRRFRRGIFDANHTFRTQKVNIPAALDFDDVLRVLSPITRSEIDPSSWPASDLRVASVAVALYASVRSFNI